MKESLQNSFSASPQLRLSYRTSAMHFLNFILKAQVTSYAPIWSQFNYNLININVIFSWKCGISSYSQAWSTMTLTRRTADQRSSHSKRQISLKEFLTILAGQQLNILLNISWVTDKCLTYKLYIYIRIYLCDFPKRCPLSFRLNMGIAHVQASVAKKKKTRGLAVLLGVSGEPRPRPNCGWLAGIFCVKKIGV